MRRCVSVMRARAAGTFDHLYDDLFTHVRGLTRGAPGVALGGTSHHHADWYGARHPRHAEREADGSSRSATIARSTRLDPFRGHLQIRRGNIHTIADGLGFREADQPHLLVAAQVGSGAGDERLQGLAVHDLVDEAELVGNDRVEDHAPGGGKLKSHRP